MALLLEDAAWFLALCLAGISAGFLLRRAGARRLLDRLLGVGTIAAGLALIAAALAGGRVVEDYTLLFAFRVLPLLLGLVIGGHLGDRPGPK